MNLFRKNFIPLAILVSALAISSYVIRSESVLAQRPEEELASPSGLVSRWNADNVSGRTAPDIGGGGNRGDMLAGVAVATDENGEAILEFDGSSGRINMDNPENLNFGTDPFSLEVWFKWDGGGSNVNNIIRKSNYPGSGPGSGYWLRIGKDSGLLEFSVGATTGPEGQSFITAPISSGEWHYVVATRDDFDKVALYVDGEPRGTVVRQASGAETTSEAKFTLGAWDYRSGVTEFFSGSMGEVSVYNRALEPLEVRMIAAIWRGDGPGGCGTETECRAYCEKPENSRECLAFVKKYHLASDEEIAKWEKFIDVVENGGPGDCRSEEECISYCEDTAHIVECTDFVAKYGLVSGEELAEMQKIAKAVKAGAKLPGNCRGKAACITYCEDPAHIEECVVFLEKAGMINPDEAEFMRKAKGQSPGDCARGTKNPEEGKKACSAFCSKGENQKVCMDFAVQLGLISAEDAKEMSDGGSVEDFNACLPYIDKETLKCFEVLDKDTFEKLKAGQVPDEFKDMKTMLAKMKEIRACVNKGVDVSFKKLPPGGLVCLEKELGENPIEKIKSGKVSCRQFSGMKERMTACFVGQLQSQIDECLGLSCSEIAQCISKFSGGGQGDQGDQPQQSDPAISSKMDQIKAKMSSCVAEQIRGCLAKDCAEMMTCINKLQSQTDGVKSAEECAKQGGVWDGAKCDFSQKKGGGESGMDPGLEQEITTKMTGCMKQGGGTQGLGAEECTKQGGTWNGTQCSFSTKGGTGQGTATECTNQGGTWNGTQCDFSAKGGSPGTLDECTKQGGTWNGTQCDFSARGSSPGTLDECTKQGGTWNGTSCDFSAKAGSITNADECTKQGGTWDGTKCNFPAPPTSGDQSQIPQGYSSWQEFCMAQPSDSRCTAYAPQIDCSLFTQVPSCSYITDPQGYQYCKQCYPDK